MLKNNDGTLYCGEDEDRQVMRDKIHDIRLYDENR